MKTEIRVFAVALERRAVGEACFVIQSAGSNEGRLDSGLQRQALQAGGLAAASR